MTTITTNLAPAARGGLGIWLASALRSVGAAFVAYGNARSHSDEIARLTAKTDAQLAEMGLKREDIARHVFRDLF